MWVASRHLPPNWPLRCLEVVVFLFSFVLDFCFLYGEYFLYWGYHRSCLSKTYISSWQCSDLKPSTCLRDKMYPRLSTALPLPLLSAWIASNHLEPWHFYHVSVRTSNLEKWLTNWGSRARHQEFKPWLCQIAMYVNFGHVTEFFYIALSLPVKWSIW